MREFSPRIPLSVGMLICGLFALYLSIFCSGYLNNTYYLGALIFVQILAAVLWNYQQRFFLLLIVVFVWAGSALPLNTVWTSGRWYVLALGALAGVVIYMKDRHHYFGAFHLVAFFCVLGALVSAVVSFYPRQASLKALSLLLIFLYGASGARLAIVGREAKFLKGALLGCELLIYCIIISYFFLHFEFLDNPNSLGAVLGVVVVPLLFWGILVSNSPGIRWRRMFALLLSLLLLLDTYSRAGIFAAAVACCLLCISLRRYGMLVKSAALALAMAVLVFTIAPFHQEQIGQADTLVSAFVYKGPRAEGVLSSRRTPWERTVNVIKRYPWFGSGFGTSRTRAIQSPEYGNFQSAPDATREHGSSYLAIAEWVGLLGVMPFFGLVCLMTVNVGRVLAWARRTRDPFSPAVPIAMVVAAGLVHAAFEDWLFAVGYYLCIFFWSLAFVLIDFVSGNAALRVESGIPEASQLWVRNLGIASPGR